MDHQTRVNGILAKLRKIASDIPGYRAPVSATEMRALVRNSTVPREFVEETAVAVEATPRLHDASGFDSDDARDGEAWADAYDKTVKGAVSGWNAACRRSGIKYHRIVTDTPFGHALRVVLANSPA